MGISNVLQGVRWKAEELGGFIKTGLHGELVVTTSGHGGCENER